MYKKILLPIDLAQESSWATAAPIATRLASAGDAEIESPMTEATSSVRSADSEMPRP